MQSVAVVPYLPGPGRMLRSEYAPNEAKSEREPRTWKLEPVRRWLVAPVLGRLEGREARKTTENPSYRATPSSKRTRTAPTPTLNSASPQHNIQQHWSRSILHVTE